MPKPAKPIQPPKGTRDLYPDDVLKRRYIQNAWRDASLRCGFDEIEGPTFESSDLYSIKSGEGILSELFQTFSGKGGQETLDKLVEKGKADFALRPEFTPTLARMYAARAKQLTKPCKWFTAGPYFRAERPQRGRLREFLQWNCDILADDSISADLELIQTQVCLLESLGLKASNTQIKINDRKFIEECVLSIGVPKSNLVEMLRFMDDATKMDKKHLLGVGPIEAEEIGFDFDTYMDLQYVLWKGSYGFEGEMNEQVQFVTEELIHALTKEDRKLDLTRAVAALGDLAKIAVRTRDSNLSEWVSFDHEIVRGLAYYTGTVFEAIAEGERAVAGGGRYDNLIELMGGPPTPAVGFAMGDVVLTNLLEDNNLIPEGPELMEAVSRKQASIRPEAFIAVPNNDEENRAAAQSLAAALRRGQESETYLARDDRKPWQSDRYAIPPIHTRTSYKSTTNPGKLRKDADSQHAKYFVEIHAPNKVELTDMDKRESITSSAGTFSVNPTDQNYIGTALAQLTQ
ncbi:MAG: ATP phosphoribosyltransferase regulatory subunit [Phycisphaerales bacterium]|nr:ATP phosphoribosyltransferase regulatory subunit [Phycisphaerales bacterium]